MIPSLGLFVKYGANVTLAEVETQRMVYQRLHGRVPFPEVFGWAEDGGLRFLYMALIEGDTLQRRWGGMAEEERLAVCAEVKDMVKVWRGPEQDENEQYIGMPLSTTSTTKTRLSSPTMI